MAEGLLPEGCTCADGRSPHMTFHDGVPVSTALENFALERLAPVNGLRTAPYTINIEHKPGYVTDLSQCLLDVSLKVEGPDGQWLEHNHDLTKVDIPGNPLCSLWDRIELRINDKLVNIAGSGNLMHKGQIEDWLHHHRDHRAAPQGVRELEVVVPPGQDSKKRDDGQKLTNYLNTTDLARRKVAQYVGAVPVDFFRCNNYLSPRCRISLTFFRARDSRVLMHAAPGAKVIIKDFFLHVRRILVAPQLRPLLPEPGTASIERYHSQLSVVKDYQIPPNSLRWTQHVIAGDGVLPKFVLLGLVDSLAFAGAESGVLDETVGPHKVDSIRANPVYFDLYNLNHVSILAGDKRYPRVPYTPTLVKENENHGMREYYSMFSQTGTRKNFLSMKNYANGATLFPFNLTPALTSLYSGVISPSTYGPLTVDLGFAKPLEKPVVLIVYLLYDQIVSIEGPTGLPRETII